MRKARRFGKNKNWIFALGEIGLATGAIGFSIYGTQLYMDRYFNQGAKGVVKSYWPAGLCYTGFITLRIFDAVQTTKLEKSYATALLGLGTVAAGKLSNKTEVVKEVKDSDKDYKLFYYAEDLPQLAEYAHGKKTMSPGLDDFFYIPQFDIMICSNNFDIDEAEHEISWQYSNDQDVYLNDILEFLGVEKRAFGEEFLIYGQAYDYGSDNTPFSFDISPAMTVDEDNPILFYVINFNKKFHSIYENKYLEDMKG